MSEFNVGDRVRLASVDRSSFIDVGTEGTVREAPDPDVWDGRTMLVLWDTNQLTGIPGEQDTLVSCCEKV